MTDINGSRALITGAASGIGRLLATELGRAGARLVLWDIDEQGLNELRAELQTAGRDVQTCVCDLARREDIEAAAAHRQVGDGVAVLARMEQRARRRTARRRGRSGCPRRDGPTGLARGPVESRR